MEKPNTGKYVHTKKDGTYLCVKCKSPVFSSQDKVEDDSGYAAFRVVAEDDTQVSFRRTYDEDGGEATSVVCATCSARLGTVSGDMMRSSQDLEQGNHEHLVHVDSNAIVLKKSLTFGNYPIEYILLLCVIAGASFFTWSWSKSFLDVVQHSNVNDEIHLWIGDEEVYAKTYFLDDIDPETQSLVFGSEAIFIVLSQKKEAPKLRLTNQPVDVLWLNEFYKVISVDLKDLSEEEGYTLVPPSGAVFALVVRKNQIPEGHLRPGVEVLVVDKIDLL